MLKKIILGVLGLVLLLVVGFCVVVAMQPSEYSISRSATIDAPPEVVFAQVNDFHKWEEWSPWAKLDPNSRATFAGPTSGEGANFHWSGNDEVGEGQMTITKSDPHKQIVIKLEFVRPMEDTCETVFDLTPHKSGEQTHVSWTMRGKNNFTGRAVCMFMDMDAMLGGYFEQGLASMKAIAEKEATAGKDDGAEKPASETSGEESSTKE